MTTRVFDSNTVLDAGSRRRPTRAWQSPAHHAPSHANIVRTHDATRSVFRRRESSFHAPEPNRATRRDAAGRVAVVTVASSQRLRRLASVHGTGNAPLLRNSDSSELSTRADRVLRTTGHAGLRVGRFGASTREQRSPKPNQEVTDRVDGDAPDPMTPTDRATCMASCQTAKCSIRANCTCEALLVLWLERDLLGILTQTQVVGVTG